MLIEYTGFTGRRWLVEAYEWSARTGFRQDVPARVAAAMLTDPHGEFRVCPAEPLLQLPGLDGEMAGRLALAGIGSGRELAAARQAKRLAAEIGATTRQVGGWIRAAAELPETTVGEAVPERRG